ncbi:MAG: serine hydrolase [Patescibacteria group bacterium]
MTNKFSSLFSNRRFSLWLGVFCAVSVVFSFWLLMFRIPAIRREAQQSFYHQYPLLDPARNFVAQDDFIVNLQPLREELRDLVKWEYPRSVSLYFEFLNTGANIAINQDLNVWPASLPKVPMAMAVLKKVEQGVWSMGQKFELLESDKDANYGSLFNVPSGTILSLERLLSEMLSRSDNTAYKVFLRNVSTRELDDVILELGLEDLFTEDGLVSSKEYSRLFRSIYTSSFLKREYSTRILELLAKSDFKDFLASGLPSEIIFPHKFGIDRTRDAYLDAGIVYVPDRPYLITVAVQGEGGPGEEEKVREFMKEVSRKAYEYISAQ